MRKVKIHMRRRRRRYSGKVYRGFAPLYYQRDGKCESWRLSAFNRLREQRLTAAFTRWPLYNRYTDRFFDKDPR